jgi:hypothetical protein
MPAADTQPSIPIPAEADDRLDQPTLGVAFGRGKWTPLAGKPNEGFLDQVPGVFGVSRHPTSQPVQPLLVQVEQLAQAL